MDVYKDPQSHQTRRTLIDRLVRRLDSDWHQFFDIYWRLIYNAAYGAGLSPSDCEEVVQETVMSVFKQIDSFRYDPDKGRFRSGLMSITRNKIRDQYRKISRQNSFDEAEVSNLMDAYEPWETSVGGDEWQKTCFILQWIISVNVWIPNTSRCSTC